MCDWSPVSEYRYEDQKPLLQSFDLGYCRVCLVSDCPRDKTWLPAWRFTSHRCPYCNGPNGSFPLHRPSEEACVALKNKLGDVPQGVPLYELEDASQHVAGDTQEDEARYTRESAPSPESLPEEIPGSHHRVVETARRRLPLHQPPSHEAKYGLGHTSVKGATNTDRSVPAAADDPPGTVDMGLAMEPLAPPHLLPTPPLSPLSARLLSPTPPPSPSTSLFFPLCLLRLLLQGCLPRSGLVSTQGHDRCPTRRYTILQDASPSSP
jgi:hypothetical protein